VYALPRSLSWGHPGYHIASQAGQRVADQNHYDYFSPRRFPPLGRSWLAIDDFGTGYSSLRYLQRFPIDALKIPKPFVDELCEGSPGVLARAIIDLSRHLALHTVAEGIETQEQAREAA